MLPTEGGGRKSESAGHCILWYFLKKLPDIDKEGLNGSKELCGRMTMFVGLAINRARSWESGKTLKGAEKGLTVGVRGGWTKFLDGGRFQFTSGPPVPPPLPSKRRETFRSVASVINYIERRAKGEELKKPKPLVFGKLGEAWGRWEGKELRLAADDAWHILSNHAFWGKRPGQSPLDAGDLVIFASAFNGPLGVSDAHKSSLKRREAVYSLGREHEMVVGLIEDGPAVMLRTIFIKRKEKLGPM